MSTLERIEKLEQEVSTMKSMPNDNPLLQMAVQRIAELEQTIASLGRTFAALTEELVDSEVITSDGVMNRLRDAQDAENINNVEKLKKSNLITEVETVDENSLVIIKRVIINTKTGITTAVSNYQLAPMGNPMVNPVLKDNLKDKSVGDTVEGTLSDEIKELITVRAIYNQVDKEVTGESEEDGVSFDEASPQG